MGTRLYRHYFLLFLWLAFLPACAPTRFVKPLEKHQSAVGFNAGGPLIHFAGKVIPIPFSSFYYGYGLTEKGTLSVGWHATALAYENLQSDLAYTHSLSVQKSWIPAFSATAGIQTIMGLREKALRIYPSLDMNAYWEYGRNRHMSYVNLNNWFDPHPGKIVEGTDYHFWRPSVGIGQFYRNGNWEFGLEYKFLGFTLDNTRTVVNFANDLPVGAQGVYLQVFKKF